MNYPSETEQIMKNMVVTTNYLHTRSGTQLMESLIVDLEDAFMKQFVSGDKRSEKMSECPKSKNGEHLYEVLSGSINSDGSINEMILECISCYKTVTTTDGKIRMPEDEPRWSYMVKPKPDAFIDDIYMFDGSGMPSIFKI